MSSARKPYPTDVSDEEWALVAPYLTLLREDAGQRAHALHEVFNGLRYVVRSGCSWGLMPHDLPPWFAVYQQAQRWLSAGCFEQLAGDLRVVLRMALGQAPEPSAAVLDSRTLRFSPESGERAGYDGAKRKKGSKLHTAVGTFGHPLAVHVTPADADDRAQVGPLAKAVQVATGENVELAFVDQGYTGEKPAAAAREHGIALEVVRPPEAKRGPHPKLFEGRATATPLGRGAFRRPGYALPQARQSLPKAGLPDACFGWRADIERIRFVTA